MIMPYLLLVVGLVIIWLEFYLPGGVMAVIGSLVVIGAVISFAMAGHTPLALLGFFVFALAAVVVTIWAALKHIRRSGERNTFFLSRDQEGFTAVDSFDRALIGKEAVTLTDLGPSGYILIEGKRYPAASRGPYIDRGQKVRVVGGEAEYLIVKPI